MKKKLFLSVVIPVFNRANTVGRAVKSVLSQSHADFELLVVDNCSNDDTVEVVRAFKDDRIVIIRNQENIGLWRNHAKGVACAASNWVVFLHSDEELQPYALTEIAAAIGEFDVKTVGLIAGISQKSPVFTYSACSVFKRLQEFPATALTVLNGISQPSGLVLNKEALNEVGGFSDEKHIYFHADHALYLNLALSGYAFCFLPQELTRWEDHADRATNTTRKKEKVASLQGFSHRLRTSGKAGNVIEYFDGQFPLIPRPVRFRILLTIIMSCANDVGLSRFLRWLPSFSIKEIAILCQHFIVNRMMAT